MIRTGAPFLAAFGLLIGSPAIGKEAPWPQGIYSSVRMSEETGDLGGMELRFFADAGKPMVEAVICEGWCNESYTVPLERIAEGFAFGFVERYEGGEGVAEEALRVTLRPEGRGLRAHLTAQADPNAPLWEEDPLLRRIGRPFGLSVVHSEN